MGSKYTSEKRVEHVAIACEPDMIIPPGSTAPAPFITVSKFDTAVGTASNTSGNQYPMFITTSQVPTCVGGPPGGKGVKSGTWNGNFKPSEGSSSVLTAAGQQVHHGHPGLINNGNAKAKVYTMVDAGAPSSKCIAALKVQMQRLKQRASAEASASPGDFASDVADGAWTSIKGYGDTAVDVGTGAWDVISHPLESAKKLGSAVMDGLGTAAKAAGEAAEVAAALATGELTVDDLLEGLEDLAGEMAEEAVCALASQMEKVVDQPGGVGKAVGSLTVDAVVQVGIGMATGGAGNAASAALKGGKAAQVVAAGAGKLSQAGAKAGDSFKSVLKKLKARREAGKKHPQEGKDPSKPKPKSGGDEPPPKDPKEDHNKGQGDGKGDNCPACPTKGSPVNPVLGCKVLSGPSELDFTLPGPMPFEWERGYASNSAEVGWWGQGWGLPFTMCLEQLDLGERIDFIDVFGRRIHFPRVAPGRSFYSPYEQITLARTPQGVYRLVSGDGSHVEFAHAAGARLLCTSIADNNGNTHWLDYAATQPDDAPPEPSHILTSGGHALRLVFESVGQHNGQPARRLVRVDHLRGASFHESNPLSDALGELASAAHREAQLRGLAQERDTDFDALCAAEMLVRYDYNESGDLIRVADGTGQMLREFAWANHMMIGHTSPSGLVAQYEYDRLDPGGRVTAHWANLGGDAEPQTWRFEYLDGATRVIEAQGTPEQRVELYHFDAERRWTGTTDALGGLTRFTLDDYGRTTAVTDPAGHTTRYVLDGKGRTHISINAADEATTILWHSEFDQPVAVIDALGREQRFEYDPRGNLIAEIDPLGNATRYALDERGQVQQITDARGGLKRLAYNIAGQPLTFTDCSGQTTALGYDALGHLQSMTDALGHTTRYEHDARGRLLSITQPDGSSEHFGYDAAGRLIAHTDAGGNITRWQLAPDGLPVQRTDALGHALRYRYDRHRRLVVLLNENAQPYRFAHDPLDRLVRELSFDGKLSSYDYDAAGQLQAVQEWGVVDPAQQPQPDESPSPERAWPFDPQGALIHTRFERDALGRLLAKHVKAREAKAPQTTRFAYDEAGQLVRASNPHSVVQLAYSAAGQVLSETLTAAQWQPRSARHGHALAVLQRSHSLRHEYDELGNRIATTLPNGQIINTLVYGSGHVHQINIATPGPKGQPATYEVVADFQRDGLHREVARSQGALWQQTEYDPAGRLLLQSTHLRSAGTSTVGVRAERLGSGARIQRRYHYDSAGQLVQQDDWHQSQRFRYDPLGRLLAAHGGADEQFSFDPAHNLLPPGQSQALPYNRLRVYEEHRFEYDRHGRLASKRSGAHTHLQLHWDAEHQLQSATTTRQGVVQTTHYLYDPFGRRLAKVGEFAATWFVWDGNRLLQEHTAQRSRTYVYEPGSFVPLAQVEHGGVPGETSADAPVGADGAAQLTGDEPAAGDAAPTPPLQRIHHYHCDQIGTPRELTTTDGEIVWQASYRAWGNTAQVQWVQDGIALSQTEAALTAQATQTAALQAQQHALAQPLRFQGQYFDVETGLHYNRFRYYDPDVGRFVSQDPIGVAGGTNTFQYAASPTFWIDPSGLCSSTLNRSLAGNKGDHLQAHHLIPEAIWKKHSAFFNAIGRSNMRDHRSNGLLVPDNAQKARQMKRKFYHCGPHETYSAAVDAKVTAIETAFENGNISAAEASRQIGNLQGSLRTTMRLPNFGSAPIRLF